MTQFCDIAPPSGFSETSKGYRVKKTSDSGHTRVRAMGRVPKKEFILEWELLPSVDKITLQAFFDEYRASEFEFTHFETEEVHTVYFVEDELEFSYASPGHWKTSATLGEA